MSNHKATVREFDCIEMLSHVEERLYEYDVVAREYAQRRVNQISAPVKHWFKKDTIPVVKDTYFEECVYNVKDYTSNYQRMVDMKSFLNHLGSDKVFLSVEDFTFITTKKEGHCMTWVWW